ncbi:YbjN domain-containing protein [Actinacidiphila acididurans]|uniref:YbjN domain-containing protein n=1 Tax=Actinacidiphila acididurans TaxID=2784346 RepID=A0ABS2TYT6_9ACTN|nr:YbjN domain-containing protein [Actinacidiphila acididurans]MBM9508495.1 YbjN domain-containing protein [Actinacidiphila acididurans]
MADGSGEDAGDDGVQDGGVRERVPGTGVRPEHGSDGVPEGAGGPDGPEQRQARQAVEQALAEAGLEWDAPRPGTYVTQLPGTRKLSTTCQLIVGRHTLSLNAFVVRRPDENHEAVYRWLLERNLRMYGVAYAVDRLGDVYLTARVPLAAVRPDEVDRLLGAVAEHSDGPFNTLLELGFATSIRKEYAWRVSRGESTRNLDAFARLIAEEG